MSFASLPSRKRTLVCHNCRNYHNATTWQATDVEEAALFKTNHTIPLDWRDFDRRRADPKHLQAG
jgi:hypothetical protein